MSIKKSDKKKYRNNNINDRDLHKYKKNVMHPSPAHSSEVLWGRDLRATR